MVWRDLRGVDGSSNDKQRAAVQSTEIVQKQTYSQRIFCVLQAYFFRMYVGKYQTPLTV